MERTQLTFERGDLWKGFDSRKHCLVIVSQILMLQSDEAETRVVLSIEIAKDVTELVWPSKHICPLVFSRELIADKTPTPSVPTEAICECAADNATALSAKSTMNIFPLEAPANIMSSLELHRIDSKEDGNPIFKHVVSAHTSYITTVLSKEHVITLIAVREPIMAISLMGIT